jgi:hypothetical protein
LVVLDGRRRHWRAADDRQQVTAKASEKHGVRGKIEGSTLWLALI